MVDLGALHSMLIEMHGGMLTLATVCIIAMVVAKFHQRLRRTSKWYHAFRPLDSLMEKLARYTEPTSYLAGIGGVIGLVVSSVVGFYVWPAEALTSSPLGLTKVMFAIFATELWGLFVVIRSKYGEDLWKNGGLATVYVCTGFAGFFFMVLTGSFGGHMAGKGSVLDPVYELLGVNPEALWIIGFDMVPILIAVSFIEIVAVFAIFLRLRWRAKA
jgi:hypothetical protein